MTRAYLNNRRPVSPSWLREIAGRYDGSSFEDVASYLRERAEQMENENNKNRAIYKPVEVSPGAWCVAKVHVNTLGEHSPPRLLLENDGVSEEYARRWASTLNRKER